MINFLRNNPQHIIVTGIHPRIIQSILDFDYIRGASESSITALVGSTKRSHKCWFGDKEILLPVFKDFASAAGAGVVADWLLNIASANSARKTTESFFAHYKDALGAHIFAEGFSEQDALALVEAYGDTKKIAGASGVGLLVPGALKLGAVGGIFGGNINQLAATSGNTAIVCSSGGMVNELIDTVLRAGGAPSFAVSYGGDRFPVSSPLSWCLEAQADPATEQIIFFGELGGYDEYEIVTALKEGKITKPLCIYIAGHYKATDTKVQFGHAKALAKNPGEDSDAKMTALTEAGAEVCSTYIDFVDKIKSQAHVKKAVASTRVWQSPETFREHSVFTAVKDKGKGSDPFVRHALCTLLEQEEVSEPLVTFTEAAYSLLVDHGAEVSGAVNTMVTARAGKDMSASLASGILTVGDRFGGAINAAAQNWYQSVRDGISVEEMLENHKAKGLYVMGIGHRKYSVYKNDPRVEELINIAQPFLSRSIHIQYAQAVAKRTTQKSPNLILNIDGAIAAIVLDLLLECEAFTEMEIEELLRIDFFNSYFLIPRTVGFIGNYLSQKRRDEGLFRLPDNQVFYE